MLGSVYLHWDGSYERNHAFFAHLQCKLDNINISGLEFGVGDLIVGSDEERALTQATTLLCVDILTKMYHNDCRIKSAFQWKCGRIMSSVSLVLRDLQVGASG